MLKNSIVDNTTTDDATKPLSAKQGKTLATRLTTAEVITNVRATNTTGCQVLLYDAEDDEYTYRTLITNLTHNSEFYPLAASQGYKLNNIKADKENPSFTGRMYIKLKNELPGYENIAIGNEFLTGNPAIWGKKPLASVIPTQDRNNYNGSINIAIGSSSLASLTYGHENIALGVGSGASLTGTEEETYGNTIIGNASLQFATKGACNVCVGRYSAELSKESNNSVYIGNFSGRSATNNYATNKSVYIGDNTYKTDGATNEIVIGSYATGKGSKSATLGDYANTLKTYL